MSRSRRYNKSNNRRDCHCWLCEPRVRARMFRDRRSKREFWEAVHEVERLYGNVLNRLADDE